MTLVASGDNIPIFADAGAFASGMGGIQFRKESRISMEKERLTISKWKVTVEYEFLNNTDKDITIGLAFPLPDAICNVLYALPTETIFDNSPSFHVWADGKRLRYSTEARALDKEGHKDYTNFLKELGADIAKCNFPATLSQENRKKLVDSDLAYSEGDDQTASFAPMWTVREKYYWTQTFPAHKTVLLKNEYKPFSGWIELELGKNVDPRVRKATLDGSSADRRNSCLGPRLLKKLTGLADSGTFIRFGFVDYILTTANYWNGPIKDFELIVEKPPGVYVNFCWEGPVERIDKSHCRATAHNFTPKRNLEIGFSYPVGSSNPE
jgi:Domain of unknown function (DUF4424)